MANATVKAYGDSIASFTVQNTSVVAGNYEIDLEFKTVETTPVALNTVSLELTDYQSSKLVVGAYSGSVKREDASASAIQKFQVTATWKDGKKPTNADDVGYFKNKTMTGAKLLPAGNVKLRSDDTMTSADIAVPAGGLDIVVTVGNTDDLNLTVSYKNGGAAQTVSALRIGTNNPDGAEYNTAEEQSGGKTYGNEAANPGTGSPVYHTADGLSIETVNSLTIA